MDTKECYQRLEQIDQECDILKQQLKVLRAEATIINTTISNYCAEKYLGLHVGDIIRYVKKTWKKSEVVTLKITSFQAFIRDDFTEDKFPSIHGVRILKDGTVGSREEYIYAHEKIKWQKIELDAPTPVTKS